MNDQKTSTNGGWTPRTDAFMRGEHVAFDGMWIDFARRLERELAGVSTAPWTHQPTTPGYYWCRYGPTDTAPFIVKISEDQSPDELAVWQFECPEWESLLAYGEPWQFLPVSAPIL